MTITKPVLTGFLVIATCVCRLLANPQQSGQSQNPLADTTTATQQDIQDRGLEPIVDIGKSQPDAASPELRKKRNTKHNANSGHEIQEPAPAAEEDGAISDTHNSLPALPVQQSDSIVIGTVTKAAGFLSQAKDFVYSEFQISVTDVLQTSSTMAVQTGDTVDAERPGGAVRFPSGRVWRFRVYQQGMPQVGQTYALSLKTQPETKNFYLITAYRLQNGKVQPLDGVGFSHHSSSELSFAKYRGTTQASFIGDLQQAIARYL